MPLSCEAQRVFLAAVIYLCLPLFLLLFTFFNLWFTTLSAVLLVVLVCYIHRTRPTATSLPQPWYRYWPMLLVVAGIVYGGVWSPFNCLDWVRHFATLNLLIEHDWPPQITRVGQEHFLRYSLGWYLVPALTARILGLVALTPTMFLWTLLGVCLALLFVLREMRRPQHVLLATLVFFFFSGLDLVGAYFMWFTENLASSPPGPDWLQWWAGWGQIATNVVGVTWVPQHAVATWLGLGLVLAERRLAVRYGGILLVTIAMWSPFAAISLAPFYLQALCREGWRSALTVPNLAIAPLLFVPLCLYLSSDAGQIPFSLVTSPNATLGQASLLSIALFVLLEFGLVAAILYTSYSRDRQADKSLLVIASLSLVALVPFSFGHNNDSLMRGSIAATSVLALLCGRVLLDGRHTPRAIYTRVLLVAYLIVAAMPVVAAFAVGVDRREQRVSKQRRFSPDSLLITNDWMRVQYLARSQAQKAKLFLRKRE